MGMEQDLWPYGTSQSLALQEAYLKVEWGTCGTCSWLTLSSMPEDHSLEDLGHYMWRQGSNLLSKYLTHRIISPTQRPILGEFYSTVTKGCSIPED